MGRIEFITFVKSYMTPPCPLAGTTMVSNLAGFLVMHYLFVWLALAGWMLARARGDASLSALALMVVVGTATGFVPLSMAIPGGSAYYFSNVSTLAALPIVMALAGAVDAPAPSRMRMLAAILLTAAIGGALVSGIPYVSRRMASVDRSVPDLSRETSVTPYVRQLQQVALSDRGRSLVYIAKEEVGYWNGQPIDCTRMGVLIPAVSRRPALYGVPAEECRTRVPRDFPRYESIFESASRPRIPEPELCSETRRLGYDGYFDVRRDRTSYIVCTR
jgi:hypothetical protein